MTPFSSFPSPASSCNGKTTSGCISRILRRILCFTNLTFHQFNNDESLVIDSCSSTSTPGVVARLMGLESLPIHQKSTFPPYRELQDDNFFILSFERRKPGKKRHKHRRRERGGLDGKNKESATVNTLFSEFEIRGGNAGSYEKADAVELGYEAEGDSENSSPNSVLEFLEFPADQQSASSGELSRLANSKLRRPLSEELENCGEKKAIINVQNYEETWEEMGELAAMEMVKSSWLDQEMSKNGNSLMEIGRDVELMILDQLLNEMLI